MRDLRGQQATGTSAGVVLSTIEAALLIVIGILATRTSEWWAWLGLLGALGLVVAVRWILAAPLRRVAALEVINNAFAERSELHRILETVADHMVASPWDFMELWGGVEWWFDDDLVSDWYMDRDMQREDRKNQKKGRMRVALVRIRHPGRTYTLARRALERRVLRPPDLVDAVSLVGNQEVARLLLSRAKEERLVAEYIEHKGEWVHILYTWKAPEATSEGKSAA